jgi:hypothetical protein
MAALGALAVGCSSQALIGQPDDSDYERVLGRWTRQAKIFRGIDEQARLGATLESPEFREAYSRHWARVMGLNSADLQALLAGQEAESRTEIDFVLGMLTESPHTNDLESSHSIWRVALLGPDGVERARPIIHRTHPPNATQLVFFPYLGPSWVHYALRFPVADDGGRSQPAAGPGPWTLRVASALGGADLTFLLPAPQ